MGWAAEANVILFADAGKVWAYDGPAASLREIGSCAASYLTALGRRYVVGNALVDPRSGARRALPRDAEIVDASPDGRRIAYIDAHRKLFLTDADAPARPLLADLEFVGLHWSPSGRLLALERAPQLSRTSAPERLWWLVPSELIVLDIETGRARTLYRRAPARPDNTFRFASWAPDDGFVTLWEVITFSGSIDQDGRPLLAIDVATGDRSELGPALPLAPSWLSWRAPHTLAYVSLPPGRSGPLGREGFANKALTLWSPGSGARTVTGEVAVAPAWDPTASELYFVRADPVSTFQVDDFAAGRGVGDRHLSMLDPSRGVRRDLPRDVGYAEEAVRVSSDGADLLVLRRPLGSGDRPMELWLMRRDGSAPKPLIRLTTPGYLYSQLFAVFDRLIWSR